MAKCNDLPDNYFPHLTLFYNKSCDTFPKLDSQVAGY